MASTVTGRPLPDVLHCSQRFQALYASMPSTLTGPFALSGLARVQALHASGSLMAEDISGTRLTPRSHRRPLHKNTYRPIGYVDEFFFSAAGRALALISLRKHSSVYVSAGGSNRLKML